MMRSGWLLLVIVLLGSALLAMAQDREVELLVPQGPETTPGTYRDPTAAGINQIKSEIDAMATTKTEKLSRWNRASSTARLRAIQYRQQVRLVRTMDQVSKKWYVKGLGVATFLADSGATIFGNLYEGNLRSAAVATVDEGTKAVVSAGGAWAFGKAGSGIGLAFGGPPGMMIGGGVGAIVGAVVATVGYNAYLSPTVTSATEYLYEPDYLELALKNREAFLYEEELARILNEEMEPRTPPETALPPSGPITPGGEEVLLNLPRNFDVTYAEEPLKEHPLVFRFRGEQVTMMPIRFERSYPIAEGGKSVYTYHSEITGTFRRGILSGKYVYYATGGHFGTGPIDSVGLYYKAWIWGDVSAQADSDTTTKGLLKVIVNMDHHKHLDRRRGQGKDAPWEPWSDNTKFMEDPSQVAAPWKPGKMTIILKLPVGELQSSQKLEPPKQVPFIPDPE